MNCLVVDDDKISRHIIKEYVQRTDDLNLILTCASAVEAVTIIRHEIINLIFLDVEMPEMSGLEFIKTLDEKPLIILITAHAKYAVEAFEYNVTDYILKPVSYSRFLIAVERAKKEFKNNIVSPKAVSHIFIKSESQLVRVNTRDIRSIEALADYVVINTIKEKYIIHSTMKGIENKLSPKDFMRVHRSHIVRLDKIESIDENALVINKRLIPIGGSYRKKLMEEINLI